MEKTDLRKQPPETLYEIRKQVVRQKELGYTNLQIMENTGLNKDMVSRIWSKYK